MPDAMAMHSSVPNGPSLSALELAPPRDPSPYDDKRCDSLFLNLLKFHGGAATTTRAPAFIREFWETERCDHLHNFAPRREEYAARLKDGVLLRVLTFQETPADEKVAAQAVMHYAEWHEKNLVSALSMSSFLKYSARCKRANVVSSQ